MQSAAAPPLLLDGAMGTLLEERGISTTGPLWASGAVLSDPAAVSAIHQEYREAGACVHTANTFRLSAKTLREAGVELGLVSVLERAVGLARRGAGSGRVAVSLSSTVDCYRPDQVGACAERELCAEAEARAACGADLVLCETFASPPEAELAVAAARAVGMETWISLSPGPSAQLLTPAQLQRVAGQLFERGAALVLLNCVALTRAAPFARALAALGAPWGLYANVGQEAEGLGYLTDWPTPPPSQPESQERARRFAELSFEFSELRPSIVGGCCGTSPAHIRALARYFGQSGHNAGLRTY